MTEVVTIMATKGRPALLSKALDSVLLQSLKPSRVIVVGESEEDLVSIDSTVEANPSLVTTLINSRTKNLSGALNTALSHLIALGIKERDTYVSFLDDDDAWEPDYLERSLAVAKSGESDMVVCGIIRHETERYPSGRRQSIPEHLDSSSFLLANPHVQGSNLFVRLSCLLRAGCFDENLESTTDRDVCIRLFDLGDLKVVYLRKHLVHHYATGESRLSSFGSTVKRNGLSKFYRKYSSRMSLAEQAQFKKRAVELFGSKMSDFECEEGRNSEPVEEEPLPETGRTVDLVVGFTASDVAGARSLVLDLVPIFHAFGGKKKLVVCDNSDSNRGLAEVLSLVGSDVEVRLVDRVVMRRDAEFGRFGKFYEARSRQRGIAYGRTALHHYLYLEALNLECPAVWILDDDIRLNHVFLGTNELSPDGFKRYVSDLSSRGYAIAVGKIAGDPPLPPESMIRTQLVDFLFNLHALANPCYEYEPEQRQRENTIVVRAFPDCYYDLSLLHNGHVETPMWYQEPPQSHARVEMLDSMLREFPLISNGVNRFRSIPLSSRILEATEAGIPIRGGNTLVFDIECLRTFPNIAPVSDDLVFRRGDTIWAILNQKIGGRKVLAKHKEVVSVPLHVRQERRNSTKCDVRLATALEDIGGASLVRVLENHLSRKLQRHEAASAHELLGFSEGEIGQMLSDFDAKVLIRTNMLRTNSWRIRGLVDSIRHLLQTLENSDATIAEVIHKNLVAIESTLERVEQEFSERKVEEELARFEIARRELEPFLKHLEGYCISYREKLPVSSTQKEVEDARHFIETELHAENLTLLGAGSEGLVFTDGKLVYKHFHHGVQHFERGQMETIARLTEAGSILKHVPSVERIVSVRGRVVVVSSYVDGRPYSGGHLREILSLLNECKTAGICLTNISPNNLLVDSSEVKYVDVGTSIVKFSDEHFEQMCRRAYLTYRWHFRPDLGALMTKSLRDAALPELSGLDYFKTALSAKDTHESIDQELLSLIETSGAQRILDYGCGTGVLSDRLAGSGRQVVAFDIDQRPFNSKEGHPKGVTFVDRDGLDKLLARGEKFDCVVCNLVLCTIDDDGKAMAVLEECRKALSARGSLILGVCNPFGISTVESTSHVKELARGVTYGSKFVYRKRSKKTGHWREDVHRPLAWYEHAIRSSGLAIASLKETRTVDVDLLCPTSDFMLMKLQRVDLSESNVSLLIKVGTMEWRSVRKQIEHIVLQLEGPQRFLERVVITDTYEGPFTRQYDSGSWEGLRKELDALVGSGVIDRYFVAPSDCQAIGDISSRWFGCRASSLRSMNGQPVLTILHGFERCRGEYILQIDSDCLVGRTNRNHDYLRDMIELFLQDSSALAVSLPIAGGDGQSPTTHGEGGKWRIEQRCALISRARLNEALPLPNSLDNSGVLELAWHRSLDRALANTRFQSYRGGSSGAFFIHVQNDRKRDVNSWYNVLKAVEAGDLYQGQVGSVDLKGSLADWLVPRMEPLVFLLRGRNFAIPKIRRCLESLKEQREGDWGAILVDAASENGSEEFLDRMVLPGLGRKATLLRNLNPVSPIENIHAAIS